MIEEMGRDLKVMMLPWSAFGHIIPFLKLSISLARNGVRVSLVSTPLNIRRLPQLPSDVSSLVDLVALPLPRPRGHGDRDHVLPEAGGEATVDVPFEKIQYLKLAYDLLKRPFEQLVLSESPDLILVDFVPYWAVDIARANGIPVALFSVFTAAVMVFLGPHESLSGDALKRIRPSGESMTVLPPWVDFPSTVAYPTYASARLYAGLFEANASGVSDAFRFAEVIRSCDLVVFRSFSEFEGQYLELHEKLIRKPVIPVGLLPPERPREDGAPRAESLRWLDDREEPKSVVFVGFGSECKLTKEQIHEIAHGLELSGLPFLWAPRRPDSAAHVDEDRVLPEGFAGRTGDRGLVCMGWVPQMEILGHPSVGGSLFHAGWGSVIETLQFGHCLVVLPLIVDRSELNARLLVEKGMAVEVEREQDGSFTRFGIADALKLVMVSEDGGKLRASAQEAAKLFGDRELHGKYVTKFVEYLENTVRKNY